MALNKYQLIVQVPLQSFSTPDVRLRAFSIIFSCRFAEVRFEILFPLHSKGEQGGKVLLGICKPLLFPTSTLGPLKMLYSYR